jgi:hypothetical protein
MSVLREFFVKFRFAVDKGQLVGMNRDTAAAKSRLGALPPVADRASRSMRQAGDNAERAGRSMRQASGGAANLGRGFGALKSAIFSIASGALFQKLFGGFADSADAATKNARALGMTAGSYMELEHAAAISGTSLESVNTGLIRLNASMGKANAGSSSQVKIFKRYGIATKDVNGKLRPTEQVLADVADRFAGMATEEQRAAAAVELFGRGGVEMSKLLRGGSAGLAELREEARALGLPITEEQAKEVEAYKDAMQRMKAASQGLRNQLALKLLPALTQLITRVTDWWKESGNAKKVLDTLEKAAKLAGIAVASIVTAKTLSMVASGVSAIRSLGNGALWAQAKFLLLPAAVLGVFLVLEDLWFFMQGKGSLFGDFLEAKGIDPKPFRTVFGGINEAAGSVWDGIKEGALGFLEVFGLDTWEKAQEKIEKIGTALKDAGKWVLEALGIETPEKFAQKMRDIGKAVGEAIKKFAEFGVNVGKQIEKIAGPYVVGLIEKIDALRKKLGILDAEEDEEKRKKLWYATSQMETVEIANKLAGEDVLEKGDIVYSHFTGKGEKTVYDALGREFLKDEGDRDEEKLARLHRAGQLTIGREIKSGRTSVGLLEGDLGEHKTIQDALEAARESGVDKQLVARLELAAQMQEKLLAGRMSESVGTHYQSRMGQQWALRGGQQYVSVTPGFNGEAAPVEDYSAWSSTRARTAHGLVEEDSGGGWVGQAERDRKARVATEQLAIYTRSQSPTAAVGALAPGAGRQVQHNVSVAAPSITINGVVPDEIFTTIGTETRKIWDAVVAQAFEDTAEAG